MIFSSWSNKGWLSWISMWKIWNTVWIRCWDNCLQLLGFWNFFVFFWFFPLKLVYFWTKSRNSILLHSGLNPAWHFWLSTRFSCCLKMKSVENILGYIREQFYRFSRGCKPRENLWNCSRKYTKMFKTDSFLGNKKLSLNQNVWRDHATMQQDVLLHFWVIFLHWNQAEIWKNYSVVQL